MILNTEVEIGLCSRNFKYFEDLGYEIPRKKDKRGRLNFTRGSKISVRVEDLMPTSKVMILCKCEDCGIERFVEYGSLVNKENSNFSKTGETLCSNCANSRMSGENSSRYIHGNNNYAFYKSNAKRRKIEFNLTIDEFENLIPGVCHYCGDDSNGIDRKDSSKGYVKDNCVPCCKYCNFIKNNIPYEIFVSKIKSMYEHLKNIGKIN